MIIPKYQLSLSALQCSFRTSRVEVPPLKYSVSCTVQVEGSLWC